mmetsp:Transcript_3145/g.12763  ORF Transcript_3145/g.12763 Transcript_3145/m.12763 type:complete len:200 (+) Transcript_3145:1191-1790(+)
MHVATSHGDGPPQGNRHDLPAREKLPELRQCGFVAVRLAELWDEHTALSAVRVRATCEVEVHVARAEVVARVACCRLARVFDRPRFVLAQREPAWQVQQVHLEPPPPCVGRLFERPPGAPHAGVVGVRLVVGPREHDFARRHKCGDVVDMAISVPVGLEARWKPDGLLHAEVLAQRVLQLHPRAWLSLGRKVDVAVRVE